MTSLVKHTIRAHAVDGDNPKKVVEKTNRAVFQGRDSKGFVTLLYGAMDTRTGRFEYCCAGHPRPIILTSGKPELMRLQQCPAMGIVEDFTYSSGDLIIEIGTRLVFYTDGVLEARNPYRHLYGEERLINDISKMSQISTEELPKAIYDAILGFSDEVLSDDVAILSVELPT